MFKRLKGIFGHKGRAETNKPEFMSIYAGPDYYINNSPEMIEEYGLVIGRASNCDIVINNPTVSRKHCQILRQGECEIYFIRDLGSTAGTHVDGVRIETSWTYLKIGSMIKLGNVAYSFEKKHPNLNVLRYEKGQHFK